ncbi:hypothetical protein PILCRDRAFT_15871 [Piloderma croceum F 1598]|uniref:Uncharacterized protein n=1 Tax=Piloderma croceum (strain F 1598) TaxID=765440 RepID=A0A0C3EJD8_PILCF|nr:hypothetical protein PILCRDRAFT_15871 [Piloderma croceum F 1598]
MGWVHPSFRQTLLDNCDEYIDISKDIADIVEAANEEIPLPSDLEKCVCVWFWNYASGNAKEERSTKSKSDTRGHPTSSKTWTAKSEHKILSNGGEKDIGKYCAALSNVFEALNEEEVKRCEDLAVEWNTKPLPDEIQRKLSKTIPTEVTDFLKFMNNRTGAVFIAFAAYNNEHGEQTYARYETDGLKFFKTRNGHRKGPNNIVDMWKAYNLETAEEADSHEALEFDDEKYPQLLDNVLELRLYRRKAVLRQFMSATRKYYKLTGRIPWLDIAENPSHHLTKRSRPDSNYKLEEPSHMKSEGVDSWLRHWHKLQKKNKCPLVLKECSDKQSDHDAPPQIVPKGKGKAKAQDVNSKDEEEMDYDGDDSVSNSALPPAPPIGTGTNTEGGDHIKSLPKSPSSAACNRMSRCTFLTSLSNDKNYNKLLLLLKAANDGDLLEGSPPAWVSWKSADPYISKAFFNPKSSSSLPAFTRWISTDPITADNNYLASYEQVELVALGFGLAFRALWIAQFPKKYSDVPIHIINSPYQFSEYAQLSHSIDDLLSGYADMLKEIEAHTAHNKPSPNKMVVSAKPARGEHVIDHQDNEGDEDIGRKGGKGSDGQAPKRLRGLSGVPPSLQYLREEVGLAGPDWESLGAEWKTLAALWLRAEMVLSKSGRTNLSFDEIHVSSIPDPWKDWMSAKVMNIDARRLSVAFGLVFTDYLNKLPSSTMAIQGTVMTEIWCRPGKTGIIGLLLCLYWQAEFSGAGHDWKANLMRVGYIFNAILGQPELQRSKRLRGASDNAGPSKRSHS